MQLGLPMEKAQYIHRLGRTARAGKSGKGLIILGELFLRCWYGPSLVSDRLLFVDCAFV